ncbi:YceH family protein [Desulfobulbus alkaliphilus]|uniref:YceH family protein n=1 Tax=Desulfobulbus alkaliphilus TaxID=869814 RepID=UPI00196534CF|nr:YceH family protein [Desulfobulbus alkaliphilus]MBM9536545.1 YceH family protein [Desulfobulbus alkaliphilus]
MDIMLDAIEARLLGSLMEKELATPEYYPLSLNALINACNQKTNRFPVLALDDKTVATALHTLKTKQMVCQSDAGRVPKYWQTLTKEKNLIIREVALLSLLLVRAPQTAGELRSRAERLASFDDLEEVGQSLDNLISTGLVIKLPLQPGKKEPRYAHLLSGEPENLDQEKAYKEPVMVTVETESARIAALEHTVARLQEEIEALKQEFLAFKKEFE